MNKELEAGKLGSWEATKLGSYEARKLGGGEAGRVGGWPARQRDNSWLGELRDWGIGDN